MSHAHFKTLLIIVVLYLLCAQSVLAQSGWQYPTDIDLPLRLRYEDVYFTDTSTGYAVSLGDGGINMIAKPIYKTNDAGAHWRQIGPAINGSGSLRSIEFLNDKVTGIVGSLNGTIYSTTDSGYTWTDISAAITDTVTTDNGSVGTKNICGLAHFGNNFYGVGWWGASRGRFYKSTDKGVSWTTTYLDTNLVSGLVDVVFLSADAGFITGGHNKNGGGMFSSSSDETVVLKTTDGGISWTKVFSDATIGGRIWKVQFIDRMNAVASIEPYYYPDSVNMIRSYDGGDTWSIIHAGTVGGAATTGLGNITQGVGFANQQIGWLGGYYTGVFQTTDGGATWQHLNFGTTFNRIFVIDSQHVFAGGAIVYKWTPIVASNVPAAPLRQPHILYPISPNPTKGKVKIEFDILTETNVLLQVASVTQRKHSAITSGRFKPGHYVYYWDSANMPAGNYLVWLGTDEVPLTEQFVIER